MLSLAWGVYSFYVFYPERLWFPAGLFGRLPALHAPGRHDRGPMAVALALAAPHGAPTRLTMADGRNRLYGDLAFLWPLMSPPDEYRDEARYWRRALRDRLGPGRLRILDLGAGGGHNLHHLAGEFDATAVDLSEEMLAHSRRLNPGVAHHAGDMRTVRLGETFDAVLVHDAIAYMTTEADLRAVFATARAHLRPDGLLIVAPDYYAETFVSHLTSTT